MKLPEGVKPVGHRPVYRPIEVSGRVRALAPATPPGPVVVPGSRLDVLIRGLAQLGAPATDWQEFYDESLSTRQGTNVKNKTWWDQVVPGIKANKIVDSVCWAFTKRVAYWCELYQKLWAKGL